MTDHTPPDYALKPTLAFQTAAQYKALFDETRMQICDLLLERAATIKELSETLEIPKGTIGHHVSVLEEAGLIRVVRTKKVRAIEAKYYGRTARTYLLGDMHGDDIGVASDEFLTEAAREFPQTTDVDSTVRPLSTLRHVRIPDSKAAEWIDRLTDIASEFTAEERGGDTTFGLLIALYPTERPHLPDVEHS